MYAVCSIKCVSEIYTYLYNRNDLGVEMIVTRPYDASTAVLAVNNA